uniref:Uncharacterized protein n=1 Tax=Helianthus annuus TaxID=4232 RepID=A0A251TY68_HELAN
MSRFIFIYSIYIHTHYDPPIKSFWFRHCLACCSISTTWLIVGLASLSSAEHCKATLIRISILLVSYFPSTVTSTTSSIQSFVPPAAIIFSFTQLSSLPFDLAH